MESKMKSRMQNNLCRTSQNEIVKAMFILLIVLSPVTAVAQVPTNFSGSWEFDKSNSDQEERGDASF
jgi:hypothetical protein